MCTGLELAAIGALGIGGGSYLQGQSMDRKAEAADKAALAGLKRQDAFDEQQGDIYAQALGDIGSEMSVENRQAIADEVEGRIQDNVGDREVTFQNAAVQGPKVLQGTADRRKSEGDAYLDQLADARARLSSWTGAQQDLGNKMFKHSWDTDRVGNDAARDAQLAALEAQHAFDSTGNKTALGGNVMSQLGGMLLTQGAFGAGKAALAGKEAAANAVVSPTTGLINPASGVPMPTPTFDPYGTLMVPA